MQLQPHHIRVEKVRGLDEESDAFMPADALAGFVRHALEGRPALRRSWQKAKGRGDSPPSGIKTPMVRVAQTAIAATNPIQGRGALN
jgi:hypothetical protein